MLICRCQFLLVFVLLFSSSVHAESVVEEMIAAWKTREARYQTGHIEFENIETYHRRIPAKPTDPDYDFDGTAHLRHQIIFDAKRGRYTRNGLSNDGDTGRWLDKNYTVAFDGKFSSTLYDYERVAKHPPGFVDSEASILGEGWDYHSTPVFMAFRPLTKSLQGLDPRELGEPVRRTRVNDRDAVVFTKGVYEYSFDPQREYVLLRQELILRGSTTAVRLDISYQSDPKWGVVPAGWTLIELSQANSDRVVMTIQGKITDMKFNNPVSTSDFVVDFRPGTIVQDSKKEMKYVVNTAGKPRKIDPGERRAGLTYDEMMTTVAPSVIAARKKRYWIFAVVVLVLTIAVWFYRK